MALDPDDLVDLALFARVVEQRSISGAARELKIVKSAVSRRVSALEARLGVQLLRRTSRRLELTPEGEEFAAHCARMLEAARAAKDAVATAGTALRGRIRMSAPVTFTQMHLARLVAAFQIEHPEVEVELVTDDRYVDVVGSRFDLLVRMGTLKDASFVAKRLAIDPIVYAGAPSYFARKGRPKKPADLTAHNCLHYEHIPVANEWRFDGVSPAVSGNFSANDGTVLREAVVAGLGLVSIPLFMVAPDVEAGRLELVLQKEEARQLGIYAVLAAGRGQPLRVRALVEHLQVSFAAPTWRLGGVATPTPTPAKPKARRPKRA